MFFSQICDVAYAAVTADKTANNNRSMLVRIDDRGAIAIAGGRQEIKIVQLKSKVMDLSPSVGK